MSRHDAPRSASSKRGRGAPSRPTYDGATRGTANRPSAYGDRPPAYGDRPPAYGESPMSRGGRGSATFGSGSGRGFGSAFRNEKGAPTYRGGRGRGCGAYGGRGTGGPAPTVKYRPGETLNFVTNQFKMTISDDAPSVHKYRVALEHLQGGVQPTPERRRHLVYAFLTAVKAAREKFCYDGDLILLYCGKKLPNGSWSYDDRRKTVKVLPFSPIPDDHNIQPRPTTYDGRRNEKSSPNTPTSSAEEAEARATQLYSGGSTKGWRITVMFQRTFKLSEICRRREPDREEVQLLDIIASEAAYRKNISAGKRQTFLTTENSMIDLATSSTMPRAEQLDPIQLWPGHSQAIMPQRFPHTYELPERSPALALDGVTKKDQFELTLNMNVAAVPAYERMPIIEWFERCHKFDLTRRDHTKKHDASFFNQFRLKTRGLSFESAHLGYPRTYKLIGLVPANAHTHSFPVEEFGGQQISVADYFRKKYGIDLKYPNAPLVQVAPQKRNTFIPLETLYIGRQKLKGKLDEKVKAAMVNYMTMTVHDRKTVIQKALQDTFGENDVLSMYGIKLDDDFVTVEGRLLGPPQIEYKKIDTDDLVQVAVNEGSWKMPPNSHFIDPTSIQNWAVLDTCPSVGGGSLLHKFMDNLIRAAGECGVVINTRWTSFEWFPRQDAQAQLKDLRCKLISRFKDPAERLDMILIFFDSKPSYLHPLVKAAMDDIVMTQCISKRNAPAFNPAKDRNADEHYKNIVLKINQKRGGINHILKRVRGGALREFIHDKACLIGVDVCHPSVSIKATEAGLGSPSYAAMVASLDPDCTIYAHSVRAQPAGEEIVQDMATMFTELMCERSKYRNSGKWPEEIIFLRDGVGDGQIPQVTLIEVAAIRKAYCDAAAKKILTEPKEAIDIMLIVCKKRNPTRFFPSNTLANPRANLPAGTVVVDHLSSPLPWPQFYLLSHTGIKGTSHPVRYVVVQDDRAHLRKVSKDINTRERMIQYASLMFEIAHLHGRCRKSISKPAPINYADLLAERTRAFMDDVLHQRLGIGAIPDENRSGSRSGSDVTIENFPRFLLKLNEKLATVSKSCGYMFYC